MNPFYTYLQPPVSTFLPSHHPRLTAGDQRGGGSFLFSSPLLAHPSLTSPSPGWPNPAKEATGKEAAPNLGARLLPRFGSLILGCPGSLLCSPFHGHGLPAWLHPLPSPEGGTQAPLFCLEASVSTRGQRILKSTCLRLLVTPCDLVSTQVK